MVSNAAYTTIGIISGIMNFLSIIFNVTAIKILCRIDKRVKLHVNPTLLSLSIGNVLQSSAAQIFVTTSCFSKKWVWSAAGCQFYAMWTYWLALTAIFLKMLLAWQHYSNVKSKTILNVSSSFKDRATSIALCAILAFLWCSLPLFGWSSYGLEGMSISCSLNWHIDEIVHRSYNIMTIAVAFLLPITFILTVYVRLYIFVKRRSFAPDSKRHQVRNTAERVLIKVGWTVTLVFILSWSPYAIASLLVLVKPTLLTPVYQTIPSLLAKSSTLALPLTYLVMHKEFRVEACKMISRKTNLNTDVTIDAALNKCKSGKDATFDQCSTEKEYQESSS